MQRKLKMFVKKFDNFRFYVRPLCELQLFAALDAYDILRHNTRTWNSAQRWRSLCSTSPLFFQGDDKSIERGENHCKSGHGESFSYVPSICAISVPEFQCGCGDVYHMRREQRRAVVHKAASHKT